MAVRCPGRHTDMRLDAADRQRGRSSAGTSGTHPVPATHGLGRRARCCRVKPPYRIRSPDQHWSVDRALEASFCAAAALLALSAPERTFGVRAIAWHERLRPQRAAWSVPGLRPAGVVGPAEGLFASGPSIYVLVMATSAAVWPTAIGTVGPSWWHWALRRSPG